MRCPRDGTALAKVELFGLELDKCHKCDGLWFDRGELDKIRDANVRDVEEVLEDKYGDPEFEEGTVDGYMQCPRCDGRLRRQNYTYDDPVEIDCCLKCYGVWIDNEELNAILSAKAELDEDDEQVRTGMLKRFLGKISGRKPGA